MKITEKIKMAIENNEFTIGIFQDLFKAFDTVNHNELLQKLDFYGIRGLCTPGQLSRKSRHLVTAVTPAVLPKKNGGQKTTFLPRRSNRTSFGGE